MNSRINKIFNLTEKYLLHRLRIKALVSLVVTLVLSLVIKNYLNLTQDYWFIVTTLLVFAFCEKLLAERHYLIYIAATVIVPLFVLISSLLHGFLFPLAFFLLIIIFIGIYLGINYSFTWGIIFVSNMLVILAPGLPVDLKFVLERFFCVLFGFIFVFFIQLAFRNSLVSDARTLLFNGFFQLSKLTRATFECYLTHNYFEDFFLLETMRHAARSHFFYDILQARNLVDKLSNKCKPIFASILLQMEQCYECLQSIGLLIYRIEDHSTFGVAEKELVAIASIIEKQFQHLAKQLKNPMNKVDKTLLNENTYELADINQRVLQVVAKEPLVFVIFVQDIYTLSKLINDLSDIIASAGQNG